MADPAKLIYIVEDDAFQRQMLMDHLSKMSHYQIKEFGTGEECITHLKSTNEKPGIIFLDYYLNGVVKDAMDGMDALTEIKEITPTSDVVMLSSQDKIEVAVDVMKYGAFDYIVKGESAFYRAEKAIFNIYRFHKMKGDAELYKKLTIGLGIGMIIMIIVFLYLKQQGHISNNPGWM